jgi:hypothetical protein
LRRHRENYNAFRTTQEEIRTNAIFLERTDKLAARMGISLRALAPSIGLSVASLFGYRNGKIPISAKGWSKLEQLEMEVQKRADAAKIAQSKANPKYSDEGFSKNMVGEDPPPYLVKGTAGEVTAPGAALSLDERVERLERILQTIADALREL